MKFVKFLLILILMGISFVFGTKFSEMKSGKGSDIFNDNNTEIVNNGGIGSEPIVVDVVDVEVTKNGETVNVIAEDVALPDLENVNGDNVPSGAESGTAVPESLQTNDISIVNSPLK
jgi:hypothetical protein